MEPVEDIRLNKDKTVRDLVDDYHKAGGFTAKKIAVGARILEKMDKDEECVKFLSFPAAIISTGTRGIIVDLVKNKKVDVIITTCGTLDHDLARVWQDYYSGTFDADDKELFKKGINRLGNVFIPNSSYGEVLEEKMQPLLEKIFAEKTTMSTREFCYLVGKELENEKKKEQSLLYWAYKNEIPIFIPGITDGSVGSQIWMFRQQHKKVIIDVFADEEELAEITFKAKKSGALMIGGGISKHHVIWWNQFKNGLDYAVYITTAVEHDGSLSGARLTEAISWGKVTEEAPQITIEGDATAILPLVVSKIL